MTRALPTSRASGVEKNGYEE
ncbi:hypothetical protein E2C01_102059 [Portunus trituberculatus]|uniref:Uncharacterized protein n=1 Tax=Portunus trituberculatus TaxID=210409 RepID=A0A5B7KHG0_PORTR|nr:hypothetical protein [Portunus trituberculatus]